MSAPPEGCAAPQQAGRVPYGAWRSPITAASVAAGGVRLRHIDVAAGAVLWLEGRPAEGGRIALMRRRAGETAVELVRVPFNVRTRAHEYGGGAYFTHGEAVFFSNDDDQRLYRRDDGADPRPITPEPPSPRGLRYADGRTTPDGRMIVCVRESHPDDRAVVNELVALPADGASEPRSIVAGADFYSFPRISPDGRRLAWTQWNHPDMPWDAGELWTAELAPEGDLAAARRVAGGAEESIFQPAWSPEGELHFVSDRTGWWNLYRLGPQGAEALAPREAEFGAPQWAFGLSSYDFLADGTIACAYGTGGARRIGLIAPGGGLRDLDTAYVPEALPTLRSDGERLAYVGVSPERHAAVVWLEPSTGRLEVLATSSDEQIDRAHVSIPRAIEFTSAGGRDAHAYYYPPQNADYDAPAGELPPLIVESHGGPTGQAALELDDEIQFFTSRGFAVVDVDYGGSSGYGRGYRDRLRGRWGIVDVEDCVAAATSLADEGLVDPYRLTIRGGSAGGYTTLCALAFHDTFAAGSSHYGVADAETLALDTHKFESRYLDRLIAPYPEAAATYRERSPIHFADRLTVPLILFQGLEDEVVPPEQAESMVAALRANGVAHAYLAFEGEQHGFRRAETIRRVLEAELYFLGRVFGFEPADALESVTIEPPP